MTDSTPPAPGPPVYTGGANSAAPNASGVGARNGMGTAALVIGIIALLTCWTVIGGILLGILAVVFGVIGRNRVRRGEATNGGAALAGLIIGAVGLVIAVILIIAGATFFEHHKAQIHNLQSCLNNANGNQQKVDNCNNEFNNSINGG